MGDQGLLLVACGVTITTLAFVLWIGKVNRRWVKVVLDWFPAILFAYVIPAGFTHLFQIDLSQVALHDFSRNWIIPLTILTVMSALSLRQLRIVGMKPIIVFGVGSLVIATLPVLLVLLFGWMDGAQKELFLTDAYWKGLVPIVGGWIGGSTSQLVLKELAETPESLFLSILVLDNILVNIWTILMFQFIKRSEALNRAWGIDSEIPTVEPPPKSEASLRKTNTITLGVIVAVMVGCYFIPMSFLMSVVVLSILGLLLGNLIPDWNHKLVLRIAGITIVLIMAILGLKLNFSNLSLPGSLVVLVIIWLILHFLFMLGTAWLLRTNIAWVAIGSMANLGGISTAPAVTSAYKQELMPHAIVLAILSMVTGTSWGMLTIYLFNLL
ncbi:Uncharacterized membrane protein [Robiginitalea myxolifaciens]|uniref:Uncharacterized membrane protein n=1 Tax=Robiginitalea myxolifaciens TaxID=400055 RepID=A0A1I6HD66_9FLAO|nr:DUF819 family protein [Robiginitalea myxolifaciens]SFR52270.1 Uncharacterized membrane protein [Robiginitalea myxolifaciens]